MEYETKIMDDNCKEFTHPANNQLRIIREDNKFWYCAKDIARLLKKPKYTDTPYRYARSLDKKVARENQEGIDRDPSDYYKYINCAVITYNGIRKFDFIYLTHLGLKITLEKSRNIDAGNLMDKIDNLMTDLYLFDIEEGKKTVANLKEKVIYLEK